MRDNYACCETNCGYWTKAKKGTPVEELDQMLTKDGGFMRNKQSQCPKCGQNSLVYLY